MTVHARNQKFYTEKADNLLVADNEYLVRGGNSATLLFARNDLFNSVSMLCYRDRVNLTFTVKDGIPFALLKGLVELNRVVRFSFRYNAAAKKIETNVDANSIESLQSFFERILQLVKRELEYKRKLKGVIEFERQYKIKMASLYAGLNCSPI
jgi:hypothetical protein